MVRITSMNRKRVIISNVVGCLLVKAAVDGYETAHKEERLGILLGSIQDNTAVVKYARVYRGGDRTRTGAYVNSASFARRVRELSGRLSAEFLGTFHTHNEVGGTISSELSSEDRDHLCNDPPHSVELVVAIWRSNSPLRSSKQYIQVEAGPYRCRIAGRKSSAGNGS
jgi:hypothetical protein